MKELEAKQIMETIVATVCVISAVICGIYMPDFSAEHVLVIVLTIGGGYLGLQVPRIFGAYKQSTYEEPEK